MAVAEENLHAVITVEDRASAAMRGIASRFERLQGLVGRIHQRVGGLAEETGLAAVGEHARQAHERIRGLHDSISGLLPALGGLGLFLSVRDFAEGIRASAEFDEHLALTARASGLTATQLGGLEAAGKVAGVGVGMLDRGLQRLNINIAEAARGKAKDVQQILTRLGLTNAPGHLVATSAAFYAASDAAKQLVDSGQVQLAADMLSKLFGVRVGAAELPFWAQGSAHIKELQAQAAHFGVVPSDLAAEQGKDFNESFKHMDMAVEGLRNTIAEKLFPVLTPIIEKMSEWLAVNREWIATEITTEIKRFIDWVENFDWGPIIAGMKAFGSGALWTAQHLGLIEIALGTLAAWRATSVVLAIGSVGTAAVRSAALVTGLGVTALGVAGVGGLAALGFVAYEVYQSWDKNAPLIENLLHGIRNAGTDAFDGIQKAARNLIDYWNLVGGPAAQAFLHKWLGTPSNLGAGSSQGPLAPGHAAGPLTGDRADLARRLYAHAVNDLGLDRAHALALLGNATFESTLNPKALGDPQNGIPTSFGLFQWHDDRMRSVIRALGSRAEDPFAQLDYAVAEQRRRDPGFFSRRGTAGELTNAFERGFEVPQTVTDRSSFADMIGDLTRPIGSTTPQSKGQIDVNLKLDHRNPPPGTVATAGAQGSGDFNFGNLGNAFAY